MISSLNKMENYTDAEAKLSKYILNNMDQVINMTIRELSKASFTSTSTITRFSKKAGASGFSDFKMRLATEREAELYIKTPDMNIPFGTDDSYDSIAVKIANIGIKSIRQACDSLNFQQLKTVVSYLMKADIIDLYGEGDSLLEAFDFVNKMMRINKNVRIEQDISVQAHQAMTSDRSHCAIIISHSGEKKMPYRIAKLLKQRSVPIILITSNPVSSIGRLSTWCIWTGIHETRVLTQKLTTYSSQVVVHFILDCIFSFIYVENYEMNREYTIKSERIIENVFNTFIEDGDEDNNY